MRFLSKLFRRDAAPPASTGQEDDPLVLVPVPALVAVLLNREREKGSPLTESEVLEIRDRAICVAVRYSLASAMAEARGYDDIVPERAWEEWNAIRPCLQEEP